MIKKIRLVKLVASIVSIITVLAGFGIGFGSLWLAYGLKKS